MVLLRLMNPFGKMTVDGENQSYIFLTQQAVKLVDSLGLSESLKTSKIVLIHHGKILSKDEDLAILQASSIVNIVFKKSPEIETPRKFSDEEINQLVFAFRAALLNKKFRTTLTRIGTPENIESLCAATPGLRQDPIALAFLHNFELLLQFTNHAAARKIAETHPALADAGTHIAAMGHEGSDSSLEAAAFLALHQAEEEGADDSDEDDTMDSESPAVSRQRSTTPGSAVGTPMSQTPITPAFLSAAIAAARSQASSQPSTSNSTPVRTASTSAVPSLLTPEMMQNALRSAFASTSLPSTPVTTARTERRATAEQQPTGSRSAVENLRDRYGQYLPQMRELGILNDELSLRALDATGGDISAAVNLIFAGMLD